MLVGLVEDLDVELTAMAYVVPTTTRSGTSRRASIHDRIDLQFQWDLRIRVLAVTP